MGIHILDIPFAEGSLSVIVIQSSAGLKSIPVGFRRRQTKQGIQTDEFRTQRQR
jgi:hypothetical protein